MILNFWEAHFLRNEKRQEKFLTEHLKLITQGDLKKIRKTVRACVAFESGEIKSKFPNKLLGPLSDLTIQLAGIRLNDLLFNTNLTNKIIKDNLNKRELVYPLSRHWIRIFVENGIPVNGFLCKVNFYKYFLIKLFYNYLKSLLILVNNRNYSLNIASNSTLIYVNPQDFNPNLGCSNNFDFISWLDRIKMIDCNSKNIYLLNSKQSSVARNKQIFHFKFVRTVVDLTRFAKKYKFQFVKLFLLTPNSILEYLNLSDEILKNTAKLIVPSSHGWIKSSWLSKLEDAGVKVIYVNLSDSGEPSMTFDKDLLVNWYPVSQWRNVTVCSENQKLIYNLESLKLYSPQVSLLGVPDWMDSGKLQIKTGTRYISVFDFEPHKSYYGYGCNNDSGYSDIRNTLRFLETMTNLAQELEVLFVYKSKRPISDSKRFRAYTESLKHFSETNKFFLVAYEGIAPRKILRNSIASINMPFASTGLIAREMSVPTCFYDIVGLIRADDPASNGIKTINNREMLAEWVRKQLDFNNVQALH